MHARLSCLGLLVVGVVGLIATAVAKPPPPSGTLVITTTSVAVGLGSTGHRHPHHPRSALPVRRPGA
jgi:hypothetical protein